MYGAILGDIIGSPYEFDMGDKRKDFPLFSARSAFTDDTVMTLAVAEAFLEGAGEEAVIRQRLTEAMRRWGKAYPHAGYGVRFSAWLTRDPPRPYGSYGNGSAMRVSAVAWLFDDLETVRKMARLSAEVTHDHPEGIKGAQATAAAIYLAKTGHTIEEIRTYIHENFYPMDRTCDEIRPTYKFEPTCQKSVPESIIAFLESTSYEDAIRKVISLGGDADTMGAITGSIAWAYYRFQEGNKLTTDMWTLMKFAKAFMPEEFIHTVEMFELLCKDTYVHKPEGIVAKEIVRESTPEPAPEPAAELTLERFRTAHEKSYDTALREIQSGMKQTHWMWYIFPQIQGLGHSTTAKFYAIKDKEEAVAYWNDPVLSSHLLEISRELLKLNSSIDWILGYPDDLKLKSCMTLFYLVTGEHTFREVLDKFYSGKTDEFTKNKLS